MNFIKCEKLEKSMAELQFSIDAEAFKAAVADVFKKEGKKYPVQGFRKGKAPKALIEKMYGADVFTYDAINELFPEAFEAAVKEANVEPVGRPEVSVDSASEAEGAALTVKVAVKPEVKIGAYNGLTVEKTVHTVSDEAVEAELKRVQERNARELTREGAAENGDIVDIDFEGFVDGVAFEGGKAEHYSLTLGSGAQLARLAVDGAGSSVSVESGASVETLTARAAVKVDNQGAINKAEVQADNVVLDGKRPAHVEVADDVAPPQNSEGEEVTGSEDSQEPGQGGGGSGGGGGSVSEEAVAGIVGVHPVDQDGGEEDMPSVTAKATKKTGENFVRIALSTDGVVPIHQSEGAGKGAWVGVAIEAPEGYEQGTFQYHFGTEASAEATQSAAITEDSSIGQGKYAVFFLNASSTAPKTHITVKWEGQEAVQYVVDLSGVQTPAVKLTGVTVSTHEMPSGVSSTAEGLSFDGSTALVQNGGSGTLTHTQVASMGGGGEYTVYYTVPQAIPGGTLQFDKIARSVNGGKWNTWAMPSTTEANAGSGWWTRDGENYYFKWGAVFAEEAEGSYRLKDGGVFDYTLCFIDTDGSQDNIIATYTFQIDLSGYTITADE